jgi:hypothetical protein
MIKKWYFKKRIQLEIDEMMETMQFLKENIDDSNGELDHIIENLSKEMARILHFSRKNNIYTRDIKERLDEAKEKLNKFQKLNYHSSKRSELLEDFSIEKIYKELNLNVYESMPYGFIVQKGDALTNNQLQIIGEFFKTGDENKIKELLNGVNNTNVKINEMEKLLLKIMIDSIEKGK